MPVTGAFGARVYHHLFKPGNSWEETLAARKRVEVTLESDHILILKRTRLGRAFCKQCGCEVEAVDWKEIDALLRQQTRPALEGENHAAKITEPRKK